MLEHNRIKRRMVYLFRKKKLDVAVVAALGKRQSLTVSDSDISIWEGRKAGRSAILPTSTHS